MLTKARLWKTFAIVAVFLLTPVAGASAASPPRPSYASATVDGATSEWDLTNDFFADLRRAGDAGKKIEAKLYLRYDCATQTMYALVLTLDDDPDTVTPNDPIPGLKQPADAWIAINTNGNKVVTGQIPNPLDGNPPDFAWVGESFDGNPNHVRGYEASFTLASPPSTGIKAHLNVFDEGASQTAGTVGFRPLDFVCLDWGDLPEGSGLYPTTSANSGPRHTISNLFLGNRVDGESDGNPNPFATGDDLDNTPDDEDGVVRTAGFFWTAGGNGSVDVTVTGGNGCLAGWIDWNNDGDFLDPQEQILSYQLVSAGSNPNIPFTIPGGPGGASFPGTFYARFRLYARDDPGGANNCTTSRSPTGQVTNGEVEDYFWSFGSTAVTLTRLGARSSPGFPAGQAVAVLAFLAGSVTIGGVLVRRRRER